MDDDRRPAHLLRERPAHGLPAARGPLRLLGHPRPGQLLEAARRAALRAVDRGPADRAVRQVRAQDALLHARPHRGVGPRGPRFRKFPGCSQSPRASSVRMGISVGWAESYPPGYFEQYVDVTGCAAASRCITSPTRSGTSSSPTSPTTPPRPACACRRARAACGLLTRRVEARAGLGLQLGELHRERVDDLVEVRDRAVVAAFSIWVAARASCMPSSMRSNAVSMLETSMGQATERRAAEAGRGARYAAWTAASRFERARMISDFVAGTVVCSARAVSACERPSNSRMTSAIRWRSGRRPISATTGAAPRSRRSSAPGRRR